MFQNALKSKKSFETHYKNLNLFRKFIGTDDFDSITRIEHNKLQIFLEDYIMSLKERISPNSANILLSSTGIFRDKQY